MKKRGVAESESKQLKIAAFLEEVEVKKRPYCRFFCKNLTARGNIKSHPKIGANSRRNKRKCFFEFLIKYSSAWFHFKKDSSLKTVMNNIVLKEESGICIHLNQLKLINIFSDNFWVSKLSQNSDKVGLYHFCNASKYWRCIKLQNWFKFINWKNYYQGTWRAFGNCKTSRFVSTIISVH